MIGLARWLPLSACLVLGLAGCDPRSEAPTEDQKDQFYLQGKARAVDRDFTGAVEYFEKAIERNPRNAYAHFELAVIHDTALHDFAAALYHYSRVIKLVPPGQYPGENALVRIEGCKRELAKSVAQLPSMEKLRQEIDTLTHANELLRQQVVFWSNSAAQRPLVLAPSNRTENPVSHDAGSRTGSPTNRVARAETERRPVAGQPSGGARRIHVVVAGDTPSSIARRYGIKLTSLLAANPGLDARRMRPNQTVVIPAN